MFENHESTLVTHFCALKEKQELFVSVSLRGYMYFVIRYLLLVACSVLLSTFSTRLTKIGL